MSDSMRRKSLPSSYLKQSRKHEKKGGINQTQPLTWRFYKHGLVEASKFEWWRVFLVASIERNVFLLPHTHPGKEEVHRKTSCGSSRVRPAFSSFNIHLSFFPTHICSTESVDEGLSFSSGGLWSNTMVSVLARQNPLDRMISKRDTGGDVAAAVESGGLGGQRVAKHQQALTWYLDRTLEARLDPVDLVIPQHLVQRRPLKERQHHLWPGILQRQGFSRQTSAPCLKNGYANSGELISAHMQLSPCTAWWWRSSALFPPRSVSPRCRRPLWFSQALKEKSDLNYWNENHGLVQTLHLGRRHQLA